MERERTSVNTNSSKNRAKLPPLHYLLKLRHYYPAMLSGVLLSGAHPNLDLSVLAWIGLVPLLSQFPRRRTRDAAGLGLLFGLTYLGSLGSWAFGCAIKIIGFGPALLGGSVLTIVESLFYCLWAIGAQRLMTRSNPWPARIGVPALWVLLEWIRQLGPFGLGWGDLGYTQHSALTALQITRLTGIWGSAFLIVAANMAIVDACRYRRFSSDGQVGPGAMPTALGRHVLAYVGLVVVCIAASMAYGAWSMRAERLRPTFIAAALQGNIDQNVKRTREYDDHVIDVYGSLYDQARARNVGLTVWPETAYPGYLTVDTHYDRTLKKRLSDIAGRYGITSIVAGEDFDAAHHKNLNCLFVLDPHGDVTAEYKKRRLVPFGEYVPAVQTFPALEALHMTKAHLEAGAPQQPPMDAGPSFGKIASAICFESAFPEMVRTQVKDGAGLIVVSTDDTWFAGTAEIRQHAAASAVRAVETDRYVVRSAATGVSQIIDPTGRVIASGEEGRAVVVAAPVESRHTVTPYVRFGDWFVALSAILFAGCTVPFPRSRRRTSVP